MISDEMLAGEEHTPSLPCCRHNCVGQRREGNAENNTYMGTAGAILDCVPAAGLAPTMSSFSRMVFSPEMIL